MIFWSMLECAFIINMLGVLIVYLYVEEEYWRCFSRTSGQYGSLMNKGKEVSNASRAVAKTTSGSCVGSVDMLEATGVEVKAFLSGYPLVMDMDVE